MRLRVLLPLAVLGSFLVALGIAACGPTDFDIVQTETAGVIRTSEARTAVIKQTVDATGGFDLRTLSGQARATAAAVATATAEAKAAGIGITPTATALAANLPDGDPLTGDVTVNIKGDGVMDPQVIKVKLGTTITWVNIDGFPHNTASFEGAPEAWNSGNMAKPLGAKEPKKFSHTFTKAGRYPYGSNIFGDSSEAVVWVVE